MFFKIILSFNSFVFLLSTVESIQVYIENGTVEGLTQVVNGKIVYSFIGIPFAEPPLNDLRFRRSVPFSSKFNGTYSATEIKDQCVSPFNTSVNMSEDCLYLNIWTTSLGNDSLKSVMFWIYGGSFFMGSATKMDDGYNIFDGTQLALRDVVIVTANYRLGAFGYLFGDTDDAPGNMGHWDQYQALEWIHQNIDRFGGNPNDITIFGVSAGSISVSHHIISPISRGLFAKGIMQSGAVGLSDSAFFSEDALKNSRNFAQNRKYFPLNPCTDDKTWIQCLKNKTTEDINTAQYLFFLDNFLSVIPFKPVFGDQFLPKSGFQSLLDSDFKTDVQLLMGHSIMEGVSFAQGTDQAIGLGGRYNPQVLSTTTKNQTYEDIKSFIPPNTLPEDVINRIASAYTEGFPSDETNTQVSKGLLQSAAHAYGDVGITCPTVLFGSELVRNSAFNGTVFQYRLTYANSKSISYGSYWAEAEHTDEQPLVFGRPLNEPDNNWTTNDRRISEVFLNIWTDFAKNGKPTLFDGNQWPKYKIRADGKGVNVSYVDLNPSFNNYSQSIQLNAYRGEDGFTPSVINNCLEFWSDILVSKIESNSSVGIKSSQRSMKYLFIIILFIKLFLF